MGKIQGKTCQGRRRKCPAIGYLILGLISLIPGSSLYYTISHILKGEMSSFADRGLKTIAIAGLMAAGILLVSTSVRMINEGKKHRMKRKIIEVFDDFY